MKWFWLLALFSLLAACRPTAELIQPSPTAVESSVSAPDFSLTALNGTTYILSDLRGRWVLLNFWATWCQPCLAEMPALQAIAAAYPDQMILLSINIRESVDVVAAFAAAQQLDFPLLVNPDPETLTGYQVIGLPQTILIDPAGQIVYRQFGPVDLDTFEALLAERIG